MDKLFNSIGDLFGDTKLIVISIISPMLAYITPTHRFIEGLIIMFSFNIIAGMRADGISIINCSSFKIKKLANALAELLLYILIVYTVFSAMERMHDLDEALIVVKTLSYVLMYIYLKNGLKNLVKAYPKHMALRVIYHVVRFEFKRAMPENAKLAIERIEKEIEEKQKNKQKTKNE